MTPLGSPVLPLEKMTVARSSTLRLPGAAPMALRRESLRHGGCEQQCAQKFFRGARGLQYIFEEDGAAGNFELGEALDEGLRGDDDIDVALLCAGGDDFARCGVVEVDGDAAEQRECIVGERAADGGRQQQSDHLAIADGGAKTARDVDGLGERGEEADLGRFSVGHHEAQREAARGADEGAIEGAHAALAFAEGFGLKLLHGGCGRRWQRTWAAWACRS